MSKYIACKIVHAEPMTVASELQYPAMEGQPVGTEGYEVTYENGYKSWCPKAEFEANNRLVTEMGFCEALEAMLAGKSVARRIWSTYYMHVYLGAEGADQPPSEAFEDGIIPPQVQEEVDKNFFILHTEEREELVNYGPTHTEMQGGDWYIWTEEEADAAFQANLDALEEAETPAE